jgi:hypothetical protein
MSKMDSPWANLIDFTMFTDPLQVKKDAEGQVDQVRPQVYGVGSSEREDMAGDRMLWTAMEDMQKFSVRSAIWMNHRYTVPEDVFGALKQAPVPLKRDPRELSLGLSDATKPFYAVQVAIDVARNSDRAMKTFGLISDDEVRLGLSIGAEITDYEIRKDADSLPVGLDIAHLRTLEWSIVGIPCNTESWIQNWAGKAFEGLVEKRAKLPTVKSGVDLMYAASKFADFDDDLTSLYLRRVYQSPKLAVVVNNFDEIKEKHGDEVAQFFQIINEPLQKHGYCIARYPEH